MMREKTAAPHGCAHAGVGLLCLLMGIAAASASRYGMLAHARRGHSYEDVVRVLHGCMFACVCGRAVCSVHTLDTQLKRKVWAAPESFVLCAPCPRGPVRLSIGYSVWESRLYRGGCVDRLKCERTAPAAGAAGRRRATGEIVGRGRATFSSGSANSEACAKESPL